MIRNLINNSFKGVDATKKASEEIVRGAFITVSEKNGTVAKANAVANTIQVAVRDVKVTDAIAMGTPVDDYDADQEKILVGEFLGVYTLDAGCIYATTEYDPSLSETQAEADKYLTIADGKLATSGSPTSIVSCGWYLDGTHKLLAYKVL